MNLLSIWLLLALHVLPSTCNVTINWCNLQFPQNIPNWAITTIGSSTVYGRVIAFNSTDLSPTAGGDGIVAQLGWGLATDLVENWNWQAAQLNPGYQPGSPSFNSSMDEYLSYLQPNKIGSFRYTFRFSGNSGVNWTYADWTGSDDGFQVTETGTIDVVSSGDLTPPNPVTGLTVTQPVGGFFYLSWSANSEGDLAGYSVFRRSVSGAFAHIGSTTSTSFNDTVPVGSYEYKVVAFDQSWNYANDSAVVVVSFQVTTGMMSTAPVTTGSLTTGSATGTVSGAVTTGSVTTGGSNRNITFPRCVRVNSTNIVSFSALLCVDVEFEDCEFSFEVTVDDSPIYAPPVVPITQFKDFFGEDTENCNAGPLGCDVCTKWHNITLNEVEASGCGEIFLKCFTFRIGPFSLGCFRNTEVVPRCFGSCPNQCSFHGVCDNAFCNCSNGYSGDDCSVSTCPGNCGGELHGTCVNNRCVCKNGLEGEACSLYAQESSSKSESNWRPYVIGFVVSFGGLGIIVGVGYFLYKRSRKSRDFDGLSTTSHVELDDN